MRLIDRAVLRGCFVAGGCDFGVGNGGEVRGREGGGMAGGGILGVGRLGFWGPVVGGCVRGG